MSFEIPHFSVPFAVDSYVEQDSRDEIVQNMWVIVSYELGERDGREAFGIRDQALREGGADLGEIQRAILRWEPRARFVLEDEPDLIQQLVDRVKIRLEGVSG
jgi:phage baseplate assembly protein W